MPFRNSLRLVLIGFAALYAVLVGVFALLWRLRPHIWWVAISRIFAAQWFWPLLVLVPAALRLPSRMLQALVALPVLLFGALFGRRFLPRLRPKGIGPRLRVATYNLNYRNGNSAAIVAAIRALEADVVAIQELTAPVAAAIQRGLRESFPYQFLAPAEAQHGLGILSRYKFVERRNEPGFRGQRVVLALDGCTLTLLNAHPTIADIRWRGVCGRVALPSNYTPGLRAVHVANLLQTVGTVAGTLVVAGDFNTADGEPLYREIKWRLRDAFVEAGYGFGFTFPVKTGWPFMPPLVRIDYIWLRGAIAARRVQVVRANGGSDHRLVVADLVVQQ